MSWADTLFNNMMDNWWTGVMGSPGVYTNVFGMYFFFILEFTALTMIWIKTQNIGTVAITAMLLTPFVTVYMIDIPMIYQILTMLVVFGIAAIIYKVFV